MLLTLFRSIADSTQLTTLVVLANLFSDGVMFAVKLPRVQKYVDPATLPKDTIAFGDIPDTWFGFAHPPDLLGTYFASLGEEGRDAYNDISRWENFPYMICYVLLLGMLLVRASRKLGISDIVAWVAPAVMVFDIIENIVLDMAMDVAPDNLGEVPLAIGSNACKLKWMLFVSPLIYSLGILVLYSGGDNRPRNMHED